MRFLVENINDLSFMYIVYELDENGDELDQIEGFDDKEDAIKFAKEQNYPTHIVFVPSIDPDDDPEIAKYIEDGAPYEAYEIVWSSLAQFSDEDLDDDFGSTEDWNI